MVKDKSSKVRKRRKKKRRKGLACESYDDHIASDHIAIPFVYDAHACTNPVYQSGRANECGSYL